MRDSQETTTGSTLQIRYNIGNRILASNEEKKGGNFMQASDPDVLEQTQSFCHDNSPSCRNECPFALAAGCIRMTTEQKWHGVTYL